MFTKIRESVLLQLTLLMVLILAVLTGMMLVAQNYIHKVEAINTATLAESFLTRTDESLKSYLDTLRYHASYLCRYSFVQEICQGTAEEAQSADAAAKLAQISSIYSQIAVQEHEIVGAAFYNTEMEQVASVGQAFSLPERQRYLRKDQDLNADRYFREAGTGGADGSPAETGRAQEQMDGADAEGFEEDGDYHFAFYYPVLDASVVTEPKQIGMCVFLLDHWLFDGVIRNILGDTTGAISLADSHYLDLTSYSAGSLPEGTTMDSLRHNEDYIYREGDWHNGIRPSVALSVSENAEGSRTIRAPLFIAILVSGIMLGILLLFTYRQLVHPIHTINRFIRRFPSHPEERLRMARRDDIGVVADSLDRMLDENQRMIEEIRSGKIRLYELEIAREKMEILAYRNQINPHFLYNTLSCIRDMALIEDQDNIADIAMALSDIFRYAVKGSNIVTIRDEAEYLEKYAKIISYRFMGKISIRSEIPEQVMDLPVIRFLLQPLVENAVFHGLEGKLDPGTVEVTITRSAGSGAPPDGTGCGPDGEPGGGRGAEGFILLTVADDGCGMPPERLQALRSSLENPGESTGIGLSNIVNRLRLFYGKDYVICVDSAEGEGTVIRIRMPDHIPGENQAEGEKLL